MLKIIENPIFTIKSILRTEFNDNQFTVKIEPYKDKCILLIQLSILLEITQAPGSKLFDIRRNYNNKIISYIKNLLKDYFEAQYILILKL